MSPAFQGIFIFVAVTILFISLALWLDINSKNEKGKIVKSILTTLLGVILLLVGSL